MVSTSGGHFISTFTFPNISAELLNNTLLTCADIDANENNETFYMAGNEDIYYTCNWYTLGLECGQTMRLKLVLA